MSSRRTLDGLPTEIILDITGHLHSHDRHNLRLVNHQIAHQLYPKMPTEKTIIANYHDALELLLAMTEPGQPGCLLKKLTINEIMGNRGFIEEPGTDEDSSDEEVVEEEGEEIDDQETPARPYVPLADLLAHAFTNIRENCPSGKLHELVLGCVRPDALKRRTLRNLKPAEFSGDLFERVAQALHASELPIHTLTLGKHKRKYFVLGCDRLTAILNSNDIDLGPSLKNLQSLMILFAPTEEDVCMPKSNRKQSYHLDATAYRSVVKLIGMAPRLMYLHLQGYHAWGAAKVSLLRQVTDKCPLPRLKAVSLVGFGTADGELADFLRHCNKLRWLRLEALLLTTEECHDIFNVIETRLPSLDYLHLDNLEETEPKDPALIHDRRYLKKHNYIDLVYFEGPDGEEHFPHNTMCGPNFLTRRSEEARATIAKQMNVSAAGTIYSDEWDEWLEKWQGRYGSFP